MECNDLVCNIHVLESTCRPLVVLRLLLSLLGNMGSQCLYKIICLTFSHRILTAKLHSVQSTYINFHGTMCYCDQLIGCTTYTHGSIPDECTETAFVTQTRPSCGTGPALPVEQLKKHLYFSHTTSIWTALFVNRISVSFIRFFKILKQKSLDTFATEFFTNNRKMLILKVDWNKVTTQFTRQYDIAQYYTGFNTSKTLLLF